MSEFDFEEYKEQFQTAYDTWMDDHQLELAECKTSAYVYRNAHGQVCAEPIKAYARRFSVFDVLTATKLGEFAAEFTYRIAAWSNDLKNAWHKLEGEPILSGLPCFNFKCDMEKPKGILVVRIPWELTGQKWENLHDDDSGITLALYGRFATIPFGSTPIE